MTINDKGVKTSQQYSHWRTFVETRVQLESSTNSLHVALKGVAEDEVLAQVGIEGT